MSTFVVRFFEERPGGCRGRIRHVASGEESVFADERGLLAFFDRMKFLGALVRDDEESPGTDRDAPPDNGIPPRRARPGRDGRTDRPPGSGRTDPSTRSSAGRRRRSSTARTSNPNSGGGLS